MAQSTEGTILQITLHPEIEKLLGKKKPNNCKTGERQTVYPIKTHKDIIAMANWLYEHKDNKYVLAFTLGINLGLRANELFDLKMNQVFSPDGSVRLIEDEEDTSDGIDIYQSKTKKHRTVFLNAACKDALEWAFPIKGAYLHSEGYLFPSREGGAIQVGTFRKVLKEAAAACGQPGKDRRHDAAVRHGDGINTSTIVKKQIWTSPCYKEHLDIVLQK